ncbi:MAG TPA: hypothetical protein VLX92_11700 [Kofleriaceae bacterium]|nr:hypothetical protein [Kofleriaceae bacterium]
MKPRLLILALAACSHAASPAQQDAPAVTSADAPISVMPDAPPPDAPSYRFLCDMPPPEGAPQPTPPELPVAGCPSLAAGMNTMTSGTVSRQFLLVVPANLQPSEKLPVMFMWYWLGGSADDFLNEGEVQAAADDERFLAVIPVAIGADVLGTSFNTQWPFDITQLPPRMDQEFQFFDDMLACVEQQYNVNQNCVSTAGVSAGALFTDQLTQAKSERLSSFISLSGGVSATVIKPWKGATHKLPAIVLWGGDGPPKMDGVKDILGCFGIGMDFSVASHTLEDGLTADGHFFVECIHNCGHVEPPVDPPPGESKFAGVWEFAWNHPFWLPPGQSPYLQTGLPDTLPAWCGIGAGGATPRSGGGCPPPENPCAF